MRASIASASNDHRPGANEVPPAIISIFLGDQLMDASIRSPQGRRQQGIRTARTGVDTPPPLKADAGDRNRTSRSRSPATDSEFRPRIHQSIADPMIAINAMLAESIDYIAGFSSARSRRAPVPRRRPEGSRKRSSSNTAWLSSTATAIRRNGRTSRRSRSAESRTTVDAIAQYDKPEIKDLLSDYGILSNRELLAPRMSFSSGTP